MLNDVKIAYATHSNTIFFVYQSYNNKNKKFKKINNMTRSNKNTTLLLALLFGLTSLLTSCASGKYYKAGADYQDHKERYTKDSQQTYNDPYYRYSQPSYGYQQEGQPTKRCKKKR